MAVADLPGVSSKVRLHRPPVVDVNPAGHRPARTSGSVFSGGAASIPPLLSLEQLTVHYGPLVALEGVDLEIRPGEVVALAGENGAGKSTLVRCVAGDVVPTSGRVRIGAADLPPSPAAAAQRGVAVVWQDLALCENLDVASNLLLGREGRLLLSDTRFHAAAARVLQTLRIPPIDTTRNVQALSGGQRQLVAVARAVRDRPTLLILDEPTASLGVGWSAQVEDLAGRLRDEGTTILLISHDIEQMFRLADRIIVLRQGRIVADVDPVVAHPDDIVALMSGQAVDVSARRQLDRLHGLVDRLAAADPSSSLPLILSALASALRTDQVCIHLVDGRSLHASVATGLTPDLFQAWSDLPWGAGGGPVGLAAATAAPVIDVDVRTSDAWAPFRRLAVGADIGSSWAVPVIGSAGIAGVITVFRRGTGRPARDELDLVALYAGHAASAVERERLLGEVTARNRVLETIREVLETLAGPAPLTRALPAALDALRSGLQADAAGLVVDDAGGDPYGWRALVEDQEPPSGAAALRGADDARSALQRPDGLARSFQNAAGTNVVAVGFGTPRAAALVAFWSTPMGAGKSVAATALLEDAARSMQLALEREESERAHREAAALRRSQELQEGFLSRLSHELRTPLTAIRGYASSLMQTDVTWDGDSERRFLSRIAAESARVGRLVDDMLDFSAIESSLLRLQLDWCDLGLVLDAAAACIVPGANVTVVCAPGLPVVWADHDRLEQVFVNLMDNALRHNPPGTLVEVTAGLSTDVPGEVVIGVADNGSGLPAELAGAPFEPRRAGRSATAGAGLGLSIANGIVSAHMGRMTVDPQATGTRFCIHLPIEANSPRDGGPRDDHNVAAAEQWPWVVDGA
jgi:signal transduction histidine kinase/ABC-type multidrug transport system ATPase subunit